VRNIFLTIIRREECIFASEGDNVISIQVPVHQYTRTWHVPVHDMLAGSLDFESLATFFSLTSNFENSFILLLPRSPMNSHFR
jgi:hypothetical protein